MDTTDWLVILAGVALAAWVNWYFFMAEGRARVVAHATGGATGPQEVLITVRGGYSPDTIQADAGRPLRLVFDRQEASICSEELVFPAFGVRRALPRGRRTTIDVTPPSPGTYEFTCGMGMLHGRVIAQ